MSYLMNFLYVLVLLLLSPWLLVRRWTAGKYRRGLAGRLLGHVDHPLLADDGRPVAWFHGVSLGEIHLLRPLVARFRERFPAWRCVVSTTTDTGYGEAVKSFPDLVIIDWPFDFTWAVKNALDRVRPSLVVLAEGELWPNFVREARRRGVRLAVVNGRMSPRSAARHGALRGLVRGLFARLDLIAAQTDEYRRHYEALGAPHVVTTGSIKYDGVQTDRANPRTRAMGEQFGVWPGEIIWVAGSTQEPEERLCLDAVARLLRESGLPWVRRSRLQPELVPQSGAVILGDTMGELSAIWGLADIAFVGGSLDGKRGGQNMIEPAAYGAAVLFGPHTWNFKDTVANLLSRDAAVQVADAGALEAEVLRLLGDAPGRARLGQAARQFVLSQQGATARTLDLLGALMRPDSSERRAA